MKSLVVSAREYAFKIIRKEPDYTIEKAKRIFKDKFYLVQRFLDMEMERNHTTKLRKITSLLTKTALVMDSNQLVQGKLVRLFDLQVRADIEYINMVENNYIAFRDDCENEDLRNDFNEYIKYIETQIKPAYNQLLKKNASLLTDTRTYKNAMMDFELGVEGLMIDLVKKADKLWDKNYR